MKWVRNSWIGLIGVSFFWHFYIHGYCRRLEGIQDTPESPARRWHGLCQSGRSEVSKARSTYRWLRKNIFLPRWNSHPKKNVMKFYEKQMKYNEMNIYIWHIWIMICEKTLRTYPGSHRFLKQHLPNPPQALPPDVNRLALFPSIQVLFVPCVDVVTKLEVFLFELREKWIIWHSYCRYIFMHETVCEKTSIFTYARSNLLLLCLFCFILRSDYSSWKLISMPHSSLSNMQEKIPKSYIPPRRPRPNIYLT